MQENFIDHEARKSGLGSSDMPAVLGVSPWVRPEEIFEIKKGRKAEPEESPAMKRGKVLEAVAAELTRSAPAASSGARIRRSATEIIIGCLRISTAGSSAEDKGRRRPPRSIARASGPSRRSAGARCLPYYYLVQLQHQMDVAGYDVGAPPSEPCSIPTLGNDLLRRPQGPGAHRLIHGEGRRVLDLVQDLRSSYRSELAPRSTPRGSRSRTRSRGLHNRVGPIGPRRFERLRDAKEILTEAQALEKEAPG
jgi:hypothetical protein